MRRWASRLGWPSSTHSWPRIAHRRSSSNASPYRRTCSPTTSTPLEEAGLIERSRSSGDGRRRYVHLHPGALDHLADHASVAVEPALFVCTGNSARSQLAAALWETLTSTRAESAGTHPADRVHPGAVAAGRRAGLDLTDAIPRSLDDLDTPPALTITVCDRAHEELDPGTDWLHWSIPDPVPVGTRAAFDATVTELRRRITDLVGAA